MKRLPMGFALVEVSGLVATFAQGAHRFALVPGGEHVVGWEPDRWVPTQPERDSYDESAREYGVRDGLVEHVTRVTRRRRAVTLAPMLIEITASELGWEPAPADLADVRDLIAQLPPSGPYTMTMVTGDQTVRVRRAESGLITAERSAEDATHAELVARLASEGFRLPTSDEWEVACGGGATTLFRWGDHAPCDRYPTDLSPAEAEWRRQWVLSAGTLARPPEGFVSDFDAHRQPNGFGLRIASDPYKNEVVAEAEFTRGGDGGSTICGGVGFFLGWLTLATAYFDEGVCRRDPEEPFDPDYTICRRVLTLD